MIRSLLSEQFDECFDRNGWFVAVGNAIEGVTAEQAAWKPDGADNSIWEILAHLTYYNNAYLLRFKGIHYEYEKSDNGETFEATRDQSENNWKIEIERFDSIMNEWRELLAASHEGRLDEPVSTTNPSSWASLIAKINAHNAYHGGQVLLLRKLQGSWNSQKGVS